MTDVSRRAEVEIGRIADVARTAYDWAMLAAG